MKTNRLTNQATFQLRAELDRYFVEEVPGKGDEPDFRRATKTDPALAEALALAAGMKVTVPNVRSLRAIEPVIRPKNWRPAPAEPDPDPDGLEGRVVAIEKELGRAMELIAGLRSRVRALEGRALLSGGKGAAS